MSDRFSRLCMKELNTLLIIVNFEQIHRIDSGFNQFVVFKPLSCEK